MKPNQKLWRARIVANALRAYLSTSAIAEILGKKCPATRQLIRNLKKEFPDEFWGMPVPDAPRLVLP